MRFFWLLLFLFQSSLIFSTTLDPDSVIFIEDVPKIQDVVDPVSGSFVYSKLDYVVKGAESINIRRIYATKEDNLRYEGGWTFFPQCELFLYLDVQKMENSVIIAKEASGAVVKYKSIKTEGNDLHYQPDIDENTLGYRNTLEGELSGRSNIKNNRLIWKGSDITVTTGDGTKRDYCLPKKQRNTNVIQYVLYKERLPNGNLVIYHYDDEGYLLSVKTTNPSNTITYSEVELAYQGEKKIKDRNFFIQKDGRILVEYHFWRPLEKYIHHSYYLNEIKGNKVAHEYINYIGGYKESKDNKKKDKKYDKTRAPYVHQITYDDKYGIKIDYYVPGNNNLQNGTSFCINSAKDAVCERVKDLYSLVGANGELLPEFSFQYDLSNKKKEGGFVNDSSAHVYDLISQNEMVYRFTGKLRPYCVEYYYQTMRGKQAFFEKYFWDLGENIGRINTKVFEDQRSDGLFISNKYRYDDRGNVLEEAFYGNLSGCGLNKIKVNDDLTITGENYKKRYEYSNDGFNLPIKKEDDNGLIIYYTYYYGTDLITSKIICDKKKIIRRHFFTYNHDNILIQEITDDGSSFDPNDFKSVNIRKIKKIVLRKEQPAINLPHCVEDLYWDKDSDKEVLLSKTIFHYRSDGEIVQEDVFGSDNALKYSIHNTYNDANFIIDKTDPLGRKSIFQYDSSNKLIGMKKANSQLFEHYIYDAGRRITKKEVVTPSGIKRIIKFQYDGKNNKISEEDHQGNITKFSYDGKGNIIQKILPEIENQQQELVSYITTYDYDGFGKERSSTDPKGNITYKDYNAYGKITKIKHPDATEEYFVYNLDGTLKEAIDQKGIKTCYTYDALGREISKSIWSQGKMLSEERKEYNGFEISALYDPEGNVFSYYYDGAGRKKAEEFCHKHNNKIERTEYFYDANGYLYKTKICNGNLSYFIIKVHDIVGRILEERQEDLHGNIISKVQYQYDLYDNKIKEIKIIDDKEISTFYYYDEFNRLIKTIDGNKQKYLIQYDDCYINQYNQKVLKKVSIDPLGINTIEIYNSHNQISSIEKRNSSNKQLSLEQMFYDEKGNLTYQISKVISGENERLVKMSKEYDCMNRIVLLTEAIGTEDERTTEYVYTQKGELYKTIKPDKVEVIHEYDALGREISISTSDNSCRYLFEYNLSNHLIKSTDQNTLLTTIRQVDGRGRVLNEILDNDLSFSYTYDDIGRCIQLGLPDASYIQKDYDETYLRKVSRNNNFGEYLYCHEFLQYDLSGNLLKEKYIDGSLGNYVYDNAGRISYYDTPYFSHKISEYDVVGKVKKSVMNQSEESFFEYDDLEQLVSEIGVINNNYQYDSHQNRLNKNDQSYLINNLNEVLSDGNVEYQYDLNGNTKYSCFNNQKTYYSYDGLDRLIEVCKENRIMVRFFYDSFHRRTKKIVYYFIDKKWVEKYNCLYLYDGQNEIGEICNGVPHQLRILGNETRAEIGASVAMEIKNNLYLPIHDLFGNILCLVNNQTIQERYIYSAFGEEIILDGQNENASIIINPWRFSCKRKDSETNLIYFGRRYYNPILGRWITCDPKGFEDGLNLYAYVMNEPLLKVDLYGLETDMFINRDYEQMISSIDKSFVFPSMVLSAGEYFRQKKMEEELFLKGPNQGQIQSDPYLPNFSSTNGNKSLWYKGADVVKYASQFVMGEGMGLFEGFTGINLPEPSSYAEYEGRRFGRSKMESFGRVMSITGPIVTAFGFKSLITGSSITLGTGGSALAIGSAASVTGVGEIALGSGMSVFGVKILDNNRCLRKLDNQFSSSNNTYGVNQINKNIKRGHSPNSVIRADKGRGVFEKDHIHFKGNAALNIDGTWKHGSKVLSREEIKWLKKIGWDIPK